MSVRYNIFLIEDDVDDQMFFTEAIKQINASVKYSIACDGKDALNKLKIIRHNPDVVFLDVNMPVMDGFTFLKIFQTETRFKQVPVIILSTASYNPDKMLELGVFASIKKPFSVHALQAEIENVLNEIKKTNLVV